MDYKFPFQNQFTLFFFFLRLEDTRLFLKFAQSVFLKIQKLTFLKRDIIKKKVVLTEFPQVAIYIKKQEYLILNIL